jgi:hypothetical protein
MSILIDSGKYVLGETCTPVTRQNGKRRGHTFQETKAWIKSIQFDEVNQRTRTPGTCLGSCAHQLHGGIELLRLLRVNPQAGIVE